MSVPGIVTNITNFGVFVDIGVKQDGLVHISQLSNTYVSDPNTVVKLQQKVMVTVLEVDITRKRISLSMKGNTQGAGKPGTVRTDRGQGGPGARSDRGVQRPGQKGAGMPGEEARRPGQKGAGMPGEEARRPDQDAGRQKGAGHGEAVKGKPAEEQKELAEDFQAKLMALKKKFK